MTDEGEMIAGRYRLITQVGRGAMGVVWQAYDERLSRPVAVKELLLHSGADPHKTEEAKRRAMREGRITARLHHPHAITVYDVAEHHGKPCLIMEYLESESLSTVLATRGALPFEEVARIGSQITAGLIAAHEASIVHRDIKPGNVLLAPDGTAKITDFGISRAAGDGTVTATGVLAGTPAFFAPEVAKGHDADFPADVFSLGATLYAAVEGEPPFGLDDNAIALLFRITTSEVRRPEQAGALTPVLMSALERDPARRPTMRQVHDALAAIAERRRPDPDTLSVAALWPPIPQRSEPPATRVATTRSPASGPPASEAPAAGPATSGPAAPGPSAAGQRGSASRAASATWQSPVRPAVAAVVLSLVVLGLVLVVLFNQGSGTPDRAAGQPAPPGDTPQTQQQADNTPTPTPTPAPTPAPAPPPATPAPTTAPPPPVANAAAPQATPQQQAAAVADYYALMPGNLQAGWNRLTASYQRNHADGFASYQRFWNAMERVDASGVSVTGAGTVQATLDYFYKDGRVIQERTSFGLVAEDGIWKIGSSAVISSRSKN